MAPPLFHKFLQKVISHWGKLNTMTPYVYIIYNIIIIKLFFHIEYKNGGAIQKLFCFFMLLGPVSNLLRRCTFVGGTFFCKLSTLINQKYLINWQIQENDQNIPISTLINLLHYRYSYRWLSFHLIQLIFHIFYSFSCS